MSEVKPFAWPRAWPKGPHFKTPIAKKVVRGLKRERRTATEDRQMGEVRRRDRYCRFPLCGCKRFALALHVAHQRHRGMGGNPKGDRSAPDRMVYVCSARHRENRFSLDRGTLRWRSLTPAGAKGPIAWDVDERALGDLFVGIHAAAKWLEVARETAVHVYEPLNPRQAEILAWLRGMET